MEAFKLYDYKLKEFLLLPPEVQEEYKVVLECLSGVNGEYYDIMHLPYTTVHEMREVLSNELTGGSIAKLLTLAIGQKVTERKVLNTNIVALFQNINYITSELVRLLDWEAESLKSRDGKNTGNAETFEKYDVLNVLIPLAKIYGKLPDEIAQLEFVTVVTLASYEIDLNYENSKRNI